VHCARLPNVKFTFTEKVMLHAFYAVCQGPYLLPPSKFSLLIASPAAKMDTDSHLSIMSVSECIEHVLEYEYGHTEKGCQGTHTLFFVVEHSPRMRCVQTEHGWHSKFESFPAYLPVEHSTQVPDIVERICLPQFCRSKPFGQVGHGRQAQSSCCTIPFR